MFKTIGGVGMISGIVRDKELTFRKCPYCKKRRPGFYMDKSRTPVWYETIYCTTPGCSLHITGHGALKAEWDSMDPTRWWTLRKSYWNAECIRIGVNKYYAIRKARGWF